MKKILQKKGNCSGNFPLTRSLGLMSSLVVLGLVLMLTPAFAQSIKMTVLTKKAPEGKLKISGTVSASNLLPENQANVGNAISILFEYIEAGGKYRILPDSLQLRPRGPVKDQKILTKEEEGGIKAYNITIWNQGLKNQEDEGKTFTFEKTIPLPENMASYRIVAFLNHRWSGTWPAFAYKYDVYEPYHVEAIPDKDKDGVPDSEDDCPNTCAGLKVNEKGCPDSTLVFDEAFKRLNELQKEFIKTSPHRTFKFSAAKKDPGFICLWMMLDPDGKFQSLGSMSDEQFRLKDKFEKTHEYFNSPKGNHMERLPNTASPDFICHDWAWYLWRLPGTRKVEQKAPGSKETPNGLPIINSHIDTDRIMNDPEAYGFEEIGFHEDVYRELRPGDVIVYSKTADGKADHSAVVNSNRFTGDPDDVICLSKAERNSIFKHPLGRFGDPNNFLQKSWATQKMRIFRPVDKPGRRNNF
jgi:hypothetical protein